MRPGDAAQESPSPWSPPHAGGSWPSRAGRTADDGAAAFAPNGRRAPGAALAPTPPKRPTVLNGATVHGPWGVPGLRHPVEMPLVWAGAALTVLGYILWVALVTSLDSKATTGGAWGRVHDFVLNSDLTAQFFVILPLMPLAIWVLRAMTYAQLRGRAVQMSPTQFPQAYQMVVETAAAFGMRKVPDAYVLLGNGQINAFAAGHGFRRFVVINSDLLKVGGSARDPQALRFVIAHEVGHLAAGHVSYPRLLATSILSYIPLVGPALSRAQEYTADNHGYAIAPGGAAGCMGLLAGGKYLGAHVNFHALADRATREKGVWLHLGTWRASHPVLTWRAHALRDRRRPGRIMKRPPESTAWFPPIHPPGSNKRRGWPTPAEVLAVLDSTRPRVDEEQFGRYPGLSYRVPVDALYTADPTPIPRGAPSDRPTGP